MIDVVGSSEDSVGSDNDSLSSPLWHSLTQSDEVNMLFGHSGEITTEPYYVNLSKSLLYSGIAPIKRL